MPTDPPNLVSLAHRIAIVKLSSLGDVLHASGAAAAIKQTNPEAWLAWVVQDAFADLLRGNPHIDELVVVPFPGGFANLRHLKKAGLALREERVDLVIDLQGLLKSAYVSWLSKAPERCSAADAREGGRLAANHHMTCPKGIGGAGKQLQYVASIGADISGIEMELTATEEARAEAARLLAEGGLREGAPYVALVPASTRQTKEWPPERFAELARRLSEELGLLPVYIGGRKDEALSARLPSPGGRTGHQPQRQDQPAEPYRGGRARQPDRRRRHRPGLYPCGGRLAGGRAFRVHQFRGQAAFRTAVDCPVGPSALLSVPQVLLRPTRLYEVSDRRPRDGYRAPGARSCRSASLVSGLLQHQAPH